MGWDWGFAVVVSLAVVVQETILLLTPMVLFYASGPIWRRFFCAALPPAVFIAYYNLLGVDGAILASMTTHFEYNFADWSRTLESLGYLWLGTGPILIAAYFAYREFVHRDAEELSKTERFLFCGFSVLVNGSYNH